MLDNPSGVVEMTPQSIPIAEYIPIHFRPSELVCSQCYAMYGDDCLALLDPRILRGADAVRDFFGVPITINNWMDGGDFQYRGLRPETCTVGAKNSEHKRGRALDITLKGITAKDARLEIMRNMAHFVPYIKRMETGVSWLHIDCCPYTNPDKITLFGVPQ